MNSNPNEEIQRHIFFRDIEEEWIKTKAYEKDYDSITQHFNKLNKPIVPWQELNCEPNEWTTALCKFSLYRLGEIDISELNETEINLFKTNSPLYHEAIINYLISNESEDKVNPRKLYNRARKGKLPPPSGFRSTDQGWQQPVVNLLLWIFRPNLYTVSSSTKIKNLAKTIDEEIYPEHYEKLVLQFMALLRFDVRKRC